jgi:antitoxin component YwqK of YwqJK toxin-antitoxin module
MRYYIGVILSVFYLSNIANSQEFGCFDIKNIDYNIRNAGFFDKQNVVTITEFYEINWDDYLIKPGTPDEYFLEYYFNYKICAKDIKMEGEVKNGLQENVWKLFINNYYFYKGTFVEGKKEGLWIGWLINAIGDSIVFAETEFENDLIDGYKKFYQNGKLIQISNYKDGLRNGEEIKYFQNDTSDVVYIEKFSEYSSGLLDGKYLEFCYYNPLDTIVYGTYSLGKKHGRFITKYHDNRYVVDYVNDKVEGKVIKYHKNGIMEYEMDYKNNLPYNQLQVLDKEGNVIEKNTLINGNGHLITYHENGQLKSSFEYSNQLISGEIIRYYSTGIICEKGRLFTNKEAHFKQTKQIEKAGDLNLFSAWQLNFSTGTNYSMYNNDGSLRSNIYSKYCDTLELDIIINEDYNKEKLLSKESSLYGLRIGLYKRYYENNNLEMIGNYIILDNDSNKISIKEGKFQYYYPNGINKAVVSYSEGNEIGQSVVYDMAGKIVRVKISEDNGVVYNVFNKDTVNFLDSSGKKQGKWINIPLSFTNECNNSFYNSVKYFKDDKPIGTWKYFGFNGKKLEEELTWFDEQNAYCKIYSYKGKLLGEGHKIAFNKNGEWKEYDINRGYLKFKGNYNCGYKSGTWYEYNKRGKIIREIQYDNE